ncbi:MAG: hypothetical protein V2I62_13985 [Bacteroidales bacterium]|nr:hypothetical protein [Bacteroidales bacterium]
MKLLFITLSVVIYSLLSCQKEVDDNELFIGSWIESSNNSDTLVFSKHGNQAYFNLNRGKEIRNGYLLPKYNSGLYQYELSEDSIALRWMLSSNGYPHNHYFHHDLDKNQLIIGNFFEDSLSSDLKLVFTKVR